MIFLCDLDENQLRALSDLALRMAIADTVLAPEEMRYMHHLMRQLNGGLLPALDIHTSASFSDNLAPFRSRQERITAAFALLTMAHADGLYHDAEDALFAEIAISLSLPPDLAQNLNAMAKNKAELFTALQEVVAGVG